ncbi:MAG TPA: hypothetical protein VN947_00400 [Polyangia bacterium]|nr:hypothetical protein [Polyangia bacterium]
MKTQLMVSILGALALVGCGGGGGGPVGVVANPYESCDPSVDVCDQGFECLDTTLPASAGFTGSLCTVPCNFDTDCPQDLTNFASICINGQCYTQCPTGGATCPYGTGCVTFSDQDGNLVDLCTP